MYIDIQNEMFGHNGLFQLAAEDAIAKNLAIPIGDDLDEEEEEDDEDVIILHMDIRHPIKQLRPMLEQKIGVNLSGYEFWLQDAQMVRNFQKIVLELDYILI